ncbi:hypothetical protein KC980_00420 [candidate division WWE3 bacterium]|uniref:Uncharacterized protein n=1 Tax=candidate division WWE3 bacterium TaxID=2053526 RepID=A0A955EAL9_UNCKA|nr:hypothetical protein [candidate division WWE3 bacterium]
MSLAEVYNVLVPRVYAAGGEVGVDVQLPGHISRFTNIASVLGFVLNIILGIGIFLTVAYLVIGGIQYVTSKGDVKAADTARQSITNAVIGFVVIMGATTIKFIVQATLGTDDVAVDNVLPTGF